MSTAVRGLPFTAGDPRAAAALPRRKQPSRYRAKPLEEWRVQAFFAAVDRAREKRAKPGNVEAFRAEIEQRHGGELVCLVLD